MADVERFDMPMKLGLKLGAIVGLDDVHTEREPSQDLVDKPDRRALVTRVVDLEDANARAIVNSGELIQPLLRARDPL